MKPIIIGIGLTLIGLGSLLSFVGHYDGILGADDPQAFLTQDETEQATIRLTVLGTPAQAQDQFTLYAKELLMPPAMGEPMQSGDWVRVQLADAETEAYLRVAGPAPAPGSLLVFNGKIAAYWPLLDLGGDAVATKPILLLEPIDYHAPLIFKA